MQPHGSICGWKYQSCDPRLASRCGYATPENPQPHDCGPAPGGFPKLSAHPERRDSRPASRYNALATAMSTLSPQLIRHDLIAGLTVALVAIPQCMGFATIAGLEPVSGLYAAVVMGLVSAALSKSPRLVIGPAITASSMLLAVMLTVAPDRREDWPALAGYVAVLVGLMTILAAVLRLGRFVKFVSRSVIVGLMAGSALLTLGSQLAPALGLAPSRSATLAGMLWKLTPQLGDAHLATLLMAGGTFAFVLLGARFGPRIPTAFLALVLAGGVHVFLESRGAATELATLGALPWKWPTELTPWYSGAVQTDLLVGAAAITLVGIIQNLAIGKAFALRHREPLDPRRELWSLGVANVASGLLHGFPGSGSFARSALNDLAGARTRLSGLFAAIGTALIAALGAPLAVHIPHAAIAGLLIATAILMVDWSELWHIMRRDRHDRIVLGTTILCVFVMPIHWAILLGLAASVIIFLGRVSQLRLVEMVQGERRPFQEQEIDTDTGRSAITLLQIEGALFFAHADELATLLRSVFERGPQVVILRMRRTQQIDFSVQAAMERVVGEFAEAGGRLIVCGLTPELRKTLRDGPLGEVVPEEHLLRTTREVFGSAHRAIALAESIVGQTDRPRFRAATESTRSTIRTIRT